MAVVGMVPVRRVFRMLWNNKVFAVVCFVMFAAVTAPKTWPVLATSSNLTPRLEKILISPERIFLFLFNPIQDLYRDSHFKYPFHEFGCYVGLPMLALIFFGLFGRKFRSDHKKWFWMLGIWFWIGSGWLGSFNPWTIFQQIPLLNIAHIQSRWFIMMYMCGVVLTVRGLESFIPRFKNLKWLTLLLVAEAFAVHTYTWNAGYSSQAVGMGIPAGHSGPMSIDNSSKLITGEKWIHTVNLAKYPGHYDSAGYGSARCYEHNALPIVVGFFGGGYKGEIFIADGPGKAELLGISPAKIRFRYDGPGEAVVGVNQNPLMGWEILEGSGKMAPPNPTVAVEVAKAGEFTLVYSPPYLPWIVYLWGIGASLLAGLGFYLFRMEPRD